MGDDNQRQRDFLEFSKNSGAGYGGFSGNLLAQMRAYVVSARRTYVSNHTIHGNTRVRLGTFIMRLLRGIHAMRSDAAAGVYPRFAELQEGWAITDRALQDLGYILEEVGDNFHSFNQDQLVQIMAWVYFNRDDPQMWAFPGGNAGFFPENPHPVVRDPQAPQGPRNADEGQQQRQEAPRPLRPEDDGMQQAGDGGVRQDGGAADPAARAGVRDPALRVEIGAVVHRAVITELRRGGPGLIDSMQGVVREEFARIAPAVAADINTAARISELNATVTRQGTDNSALTRQNAAYALRLIGTTAALTREQASSAAQARAHAVEAERLNGQLVELQGRMRADADTHRAAAAAGEQVIQTRLNEIAALNGQMRGLERAGLTHESVNRLRMDIAQLTGEVATARTAATERQLRINELTAASASELTRHNLEVGRLSTSLAAALGGGDSGAAAAAGVVAAGAAADAELQRLQATVRDLTASGREMGQALEEALGELRQMTTDLQARDDEIVNLRGRITAIGESVPVAQYNMRLRVVQNVQRQRDQFRDQNATFQTRIQDLERQLQEARRAVPAAAGGTGGDGGVLNDEAEARVIQLEQRITMMINQYQYHTRYAEEVAVTQRDVLHYNLVVNVNSSVNNVIRGDSDRIRNLTNAATRFFRNLDLSQLPSDGSLPALDLSRNSSSPLAGFQTIAGVVRYISEFGVMDPISAIMYIKRVLQTYGFKRMSRIVRDGCPETDFLDHPFTAYPSVLIGNAPATLGNALVDYLVLALQSAEVIVRISEDSDEIVEDHLNTDAFPVNTWMGLWPRIHDLFEQICEGLSGELSREPTLSEIFNSLIELCVIASNTTNPATGQPFGFRVDLEDPYCLDDEYGEDDEEEEDGNDDEEHGDDGGDGGGDDDDDLGGGAAPSGKVFSAPRPPDAPPPPQPAPPPPPPPPSAPARGGDASARGDMPMPSWFKRKVHNRAQIPIWLAENLGRIEVQMGEIQRLVDVYTIEYGQVVHNSDMQELAGALGTMNHAVARRSRELLMDVRGRLMETQGIVLQRGYVQETYQSLQSAFKCVHLIDEVAETIRIQVDHINTTRSACVRAASNPVPTPAALAAQGRAAAAAAAAVVVAPPAPTPAPTLTPTPAPAPSAAVLAARARAEIAEAAARGQAWAMSPTAERARLAVARAAAAEAVDASAAAPAASPATATRARLAAAGAAARAMLASAAAPAAPSRPCERCGHGVCVCAMMRPDDGSIMFDVGPA